ncbi:terminase small subunit [Pseudoalteromonas piscicida]|uniref:terminase small subunit n=1 Tax=Pseudoalteromonas piscicida TaxID=43662 RepID=UPI000698FDD4|nr:terminase small subunit [Pseudoalteromonas piscicida]
MATQREVAEYFDVDERTIRNWQKIPGFPASKGRGGYCYQSISRWLVACSAVSRLATSNSNSSDLDESEKALEIAEKKLKIRKAEIDIEHKEFDLEVKEKRFAPIELITRTLELVSVAMASNLEALLPKLKKAWPDMPPDAIDVIQKVVAVSKNEVAHIEPDLSSYEASDLVGGEERTEPA